MGLFFSKSYNPNLHNIARSGRIGFKTKTPNNCAKGRHDCFFVFGQQREALFELFDLAIFQQKKYRRSKSQEQLNLFYLKRCKISWDATDNFRLFLLVLTETFHFKNPTNRDIYAIVRLITFQHT